MSTLPERLYSAAQVRELEQLAIQQHGVPESVLMQRAGQAAWEVLRQRWPEAQRILVLAGGGNNAGDGYVLAGCARAAGCQVTVLTVADSSHLKHAAADARDLYRRDGGSEQPFNGVLPDADVRVDALLGTGLDRMLMGPMREAVEQLNRASIPVLSLDIPSGLHADTGAVMGAAVAADATVTFIALKPGLLTGAGPSCCGDVSFDALGIPPEWAAHLPPRARRSVSVDARLPKRARDAHKGMFGHVLVLGGDHGMGGAVRLAAEAALRSGAGLVSIATRAAHVPGILAGLPEAMVHAAETAEAITALLERATVVVVGPGLGRDEWGRALFEKAQTTSAPLVIDADALNLLARSPARRENWILTPHPGEAGRMLDKDTARVQADRYQALQQLVDRYGGTVVLKGAGSLVGAAGELTTVCGRGNPGMAVPGMGDALTGIIAALVAQGLAPFHAANAGVYLHATAGDRAALRGERGMLTRDLLGELRGLVNLQ